MSIVSNNIKYLRRLNGLTQEQFARKIGIKRSLLGAYEEARANPNLTNLKNMAHAFGVSVDQILKNDLRRIRETPDLGLPFDPAAKSPAAPLLRDKAAVQPQPLSTVVSKFQPPKPSLRLVARPITLKPVHRETFNHAVVTSSAPPAAPPRFNNHYEQSSTPAMAPRLEASSPEQTIQWVKTSQANEYLANFQNSTYLTRLPVFRLPNLPAGHYRAFEAGQDFLYPGALLVGSFVRNWYEIKDEKLYVLVIKTTGMLARRAVNQVKARGILILSSDSDTIPDLEVPIGDVLEVWEIKAFISQSLPARVPSSKKLRNLLADLRDELNRTELPDRFLA